MNSRVWAAVVLASLAASTRAQAQDSKLGYHCLIETRQTVKLTSSALGMVAELTVDRGDVVHKGQVLGKLDDRVEAANFALAKVKSINNFEITAHRARLDWLRMKFDRAAELSISRIASKNSRDEAESDMKVEEQQLHLSELQHAIAQLEAQQAEAVLAQKSFVSPINGVVVERLLAVGEYRNDQSAILTLAELDPLRVEVFLPTAAYGRVVVGSVAHVLPEEPVGG